MQIRAIRAAVFAFTVMMSLAPTMLRAEDVIFGAGFSLTGPQATYGEDASRGVDIAIEQVNAMGGILGRPVRVDYQDTSADRAKAVSVYQRFAADPSIVAMLSITTSEFVALTPVTKELKLPLISTSSAMISEFTPYTFRLALVADKAMPSVLRRLKQIENASTVAIIFGEDNNFTVAEADAVKRAAEPAGLEVTATESFRSGDQNFVLQLNRIAAHRPDILYVAAITNEAGLIINQARALGLEARIVGGAGLNDSRIGDIAGKAADGFVTYLPFNPESTRPETKKFVQLYSEKYGDKAVPAFSAYGYDAILLLADALNRAGKIDRDSLAEALGQTKEFAGASSLYQYNGSGDNLYQEPILNEFKDGKFLELKTD